jgi:hypothetical protein
MEMTHARVLLAALLIGGVSYVPCRAADYFVAPGGSDAAGDGSTERPLATVGAALELAQPGDRVVLRGGEYRLAGTLTFPRSGSAGKPITLAAFEGESVALLGSVRLTGWEPDEGRIWKVRTPAGSHGGMVRGLYEDAERLTHPRPDWGTRENPPRSELKAPGTWTQEDGWIYLYRARGGLAGQPPHRSLAARRNERQAALAPGGEAAPPLRRADGLRHLGRPLPRWSDASSPLLELRR